MNQPSRKRRRPAALFTATLALGALASQPAVGQFVLSNATAVNAGVRVHNTCFYLSSTLGEPVSGPTSAGIYRITAGVLGQPAPTSAQRDSLFNTSFEDCNP